MSVDADVAHADEQVLAVAEYLVDDVTRQSDGGELRDPHVTPRERLAGQGLPQLGRRPVTVSPSGICPTYPAPVCYMQVSAVRTR